MGAGEGNSAETNKDRPERFLAVRELANQLDVIIDRQQRLAIQGITIDIQGTMLRQDQLIQGYIQLNRKIDPGIALALTIQSHLWDSLDDIANLWSQAPWCSSTELDYSFEQYASRRTGRDPITIGNWIRTAELWLVSKIGPKGEIALIDPGTGQVLLEQKGGETNPVMKKWDPFTVDFSKLLLTNKQARDGTLGEVGYGLLLNPEARWHDIRDYIHGLNPWEQESKEFHALGFFIKSGLLYAHRNDHSEIIGNLELDSEDLLVREGIAKIIRTLSIPILI